MAKSAASCREPIHACLQIVGRGGGIVSLAGRRGLSAMERCCGHHRVPGTGTIRASGGKLPGGPAGRIAAAFERHVADGKKMQIR